MEELMQAALAASEERKRDALKVLTGDARIGDGSETVTAGPLLLGMGAAAKYLGVSRATLWRMIQVGRIEKVELLPGSYRVRRRDLEEWVKGE